MEKKEVEIGNPVTIGQVTLIPVVEFSLNHWRGGSRFSCFGIKHPASIVVVSPAGALRHKNMLALAEYSVNEIKLQR
ncbi:hypothetical protein ACFLUS_05985 [Chloroflexota bacterium]